MKVISFKLSEGNNYIRRTKLSTPYMFNDPRARQGCGRGSALRTSAVTAPAQTPQSLLSHGARGTVCPPSARASARGLHRHLLPTYHQVRTFDLQFSPTV